MSHLLRCPVFEVSDCTSLSGDDVCPRIVEGVRGLTSVESHVGQW